MIVVSCSHNIYRELCNKVLVHIAQAGSPIIKIITLFRNLQ